MHKTIKWKDIGNVQVNVHPKGNTYYHVGKRKTVEWWYDKHVKSWTIYTINSGKFQESEAQHVYGKDQVALIVNELGDSNG